MKNILLIEKSPDGLKSIKTYLAEINAQHVRYRSVQDAILSGVVPDLVVLHADRDHKKYRSDIDLLKRDSSFSKIPRISLVPIDKKGSPKYKTMDNELSLQMPVEKLKFVATLADILGIPQRRVFRILVTVQAHGSTLKYSCMSLDFSETGMAFESTADFPEGQAIVVSFINPRGRKRIILEAEIVRKKANISGTLRFYGARFSEMTKQDKRDLLDFITGKA